MLRCPRCNLDLPKGKGTNRNWSDFQWRQQTAVCIAQNTRFNCCRRCSDKYFRLYPPFNRFSMKYEDAGWTALCHALRTAWPAEDWLRWDASCNVPLRNEWAQLMPQSRTLLKALSHNGAIRSRWPRAKLDLQYYCSLSQQIFIDATNAVYGFIFRHVWQACCLSESLGDVILGDLVESVLGFWWVLQVSEMMATHKYSETMRSFLPNLEIAVTSVYYWRSQDGPWFCAQSSALASLQAVHD